MAVDDAKLERLVLAEQVRALYSRGPLPILTSPINGCILAYFFYHRAGISGGVLGGWLGAVTLVAALRLGLHAAYWRSRPSAGSAREWGRAFTSGATLAGLGWGAVAVVLYPSQDLVAQVLGLFVVGGMSAGAAAFSASYPPAFFGFAVSAIAPWVIRLSIEGDRLHLSMAVMGAVFLLALAKIARGGFRMFTTSVTLQHQNTELVEELSVAQGRLTNLNQELEQKVAERTFALQQTLSSLRVAEQTAREAVRARDEFLAVASHELISPLSTFKMQFQLLEHDLSRLGESSTAAMSGRSSMLKKHISRFANLIETVLDVARLGVGRLEIDPKPVDFSRLLHELLGSMRAELAAKSCALVEEIDDQVVGEWDAVRLEQVVVNLISNAAKYGAGKPVRVALKKGEGEVTLVVQDQGIGISEHDVGRIFGKFERAPGADRHSSGLGLGLYVVRHLVEAMGGTIEVQSKSGEGSAFTVVLPTQPHLRPPSASREASGLELEN